MPGRIRDVPGFVRVTEAAQILDMSEAHLWDLIGQGKVPVCRISQRIVRIPLSWLEELSATRVAS